MKIITLVGSRVLIVVSAAMVVIGGMRLSWQSKSADKKVDIVQQKINNKKAIRSATILVVKNHQIVAEITKGNINQDSPIALASISKLFNDAVIFSLIDKGLITYDTKAVDLLGDDVRYINVIDGIDYSDKITIRHLIDHTSGLSDYETDKLPDGSVLIDDLLHGDRYVDYDESLRLTKQLRGKFAPGERNKAYYSNMNANLLAKVAEQVTGKPIRELFETYIFEPLKLQHTTISTSGGYQPFYAGDTPLTLPEYLSSSPAAGGVIPTNRELMIFIQAFMNGTLFDKAHITNPEFRSIQFFPMRYGSGMMSLSMSSVMSPLFPAPQIIGHSGSTGSFAYYLPAKDAFITGTINQSEVRP